MPDGKIMLAAGRVILYQQYFLEHEKTSYLINFHHKMVTREQWMASLFAHKKWITECCSLLDAFGGNVAIINTYIFLIDWLID